MPIFSIKGPDGRTYDIEGPAGGTEEGARQFLMSKMTPSDTATDAGAPAMERMAASFKVDPLSYWQEKYPGAFKDKSGNIVIQDPATGNRKVVNRAGLDVGDVAEVVSSIPSMIGGGVGAVVGAPAGPGGAIAGAAAGSALGDVVRQGIGGLLPGNEKAGLNERALSVAKEGAIGALGQGAGELMVKTLGRWAPWDFAAKANQAAAATPHGVEGQAILEGGIPLTTAQAFGDKGSWMTRMEDMARRLPWTSSAFLENDQKAVKASFDVLQGAMDKMFNSQITEEGYGRMAINAFDTAFNDLVKARRDAAKRDFGAASMANQKIDISNTHAAIGKIVDDLDVAGLGGATQGLIGELKDLQKSLMVRKEFPVGRPNTMQGFEGLTGPRDVRIAFEEGPIPARDFQRILEVWGEFAAGKGKPFKDVDFAQQRMVSSRVFGALQDDLSKAAESAAGGEAAQALKAARDNYRQNTAQLDLLRGHTIGKILNVESPSPEAIAEKIVKMKPGELEFAVKFLGDHDPVFMDATRRYFLENAISKSLPPASARGSGVSPSVYVGMSAEERAGQPLQFSAAKFLSALPPERTLNTLYGGQYYGQVSLAAKALERIAATPAEGSKTFGMGAMWDAIQAAGNPLQWPRAVLNMASSKEIVRRAVTPEGRARALTPTSYGQRTAAGPRMTAQALFGGGGEPSSNP